jgi:hypothetical protein
LDACSFERRRFPFLDERGEGRIEFSNEAVEPFVVAGEGTAESAICCRGAHLVVEKSEFWVAECDVLHFAKSYSGLEFAARLGGSIGFRETDFRIGNKGWGKLDIFKIGEGFQE